jgi:ribosomal protein L32
MTKEKKPGRTGSKRRTRAGAGRAPRPARDAVAGPAVKKCPACGKLVIDGWKVCPVCGAGLDPGAVRRA